MLYININLVTVQTLQTGLADLIKLNAFCELGNTQVTYVIKRSVVLYNYLHYDVLRHGHKINCFPTVDDTRNFCGQCRSRSDYTECAI